MSANYRPRRVLAVLAVLLLPAATCGVAPSLQELLRRIELAESRTARLEAFAANARLPLVLMDQHDIVIGTVLEYNDVMLYMSVLSPDRRPSAAPPSSAFATVLFESPEGSAVVLEANKLSLHAPPREGFRWIYFESRDCTGTPYTDWPNYGSSWREAWLHENVLYLAPLDWTWGVERTFHSRIVRQMYADGRYDEQCEVPGPPYVDAFRQTEATAPFEPVANLSVYTPPFRIVDQRELFGF